MLRKWKRLAVVMVVGAALGSGNAALPAAGAWGNAALPAAGAWGNAALPAAGAWGNAALPAASAWQAVKRLILTDGSFQTATEWKKEGERVKYFSAERGEWEELPTALVDWKATDEWNAQSAQSTSEELKQETAEEVAARKDEQLNTPLVAAELRLPADGGVFLLEEAGKPVLQKLDGSKIQVNGNEGKTMLKRSFDPLARQVQTIELKGAAAKVRVHAVALSIFLDVENDQGPIAGDNFRIVRLEKKKELRRLATAKVDVAGGESITERFLHSRAEKFGGNWWKLIAMEDLTPGEYAIVSTVAGQDAVVWDFGVDK